MNQLANALKPVVLPGETMRVFILREGKEYNQGVAYLDDGTMVVVDVGRKMINKTIDIIVTSVHQTTAGKMIFGRYDERSAGPAGGEPVGTALSRVAKRRRSVRRALIIRSREDRRFRTRWRLCRHLRVLLLHALDRKPAMSRITAILPAAGLGTRMGVETPKQFLELGGEPLVIFTLRRLAACAAITDFILATRADELSFLEDKVSKARIGRPARVVHGGETRQQSVANALAQVAPETEIVMVHDAVRPFVTVEQLDRLIVEARERGAVILGIPAIDTVKEVKRESLPEDVARITGTISRERIVLAQTPQAFRFGILREAFARAEADGVTASDEASLVERLWQGCVRGARFGAEFEDHAALGYGSGAILFGAGASSAEMILGDSELLHHLSLKASMCLSGCHAGWPYPKPMPFGGACPYLVSTTRVPRRWRASTWFLRTN